MYRSPPAATSMRDIYIGRQAIFDRRMNVYAYELLFRSGLQEQLSTSPTFGWRQRHLDGVAEYFHGDRSGAIAGPHLVFVNLTRKFILERRELPFEKERVVMELLEDIPVDEHLVQAVRELSESGHLLALDDYTFEVSWDPLLHSGRHHQDRGPCLVP